MNWDSDCGTVSYSKPESLAKERSCQGARVPLRAARQTPSLGEARTARLCCALVWTDRRLVRAARWWTASAMFIIATLASTSGARAAGAVDRTNVPLKNWGGFAEYRDSVYDDLERLVTAGLADRVLLNPKPLSRVEAARIVARAIEKIRRDDTGGLNARRDLEPVLDRLMEEFRVELASLGVHAPGGPAPLGFVSFLL